MPFANVCPIHKMRLNENKEEKTKFFLPHVYSSLRAVLARGLVTKYGEIN
jgi:hypothetical protein